jgi:predicted RNA binding protein YcfA (HicA-like mRNA interferase family)
VITAKAMVVALLRAGFTEVRQRGSHRIFARGSRRAIVPMHGGDLKPGTLRAILDSAGLTADQVLELL